MKEVDPNNLISPPSWSLAVGEAGRYLILASAALFAVAALAWILSPRVERIDRVGKYAFTLACLCLIGSFSSLALLFATNRFEYAYVFGHADSKNALGYRIAGIWSGQEGSFLLWAVCSAVFGLFTVGRTIQYRRWYTIAFSFFLGGIASILAFESPFNLNLIEGKAFVPTEGLGLAPSLQNYWVIIHPPTIFLGFGSLTALFALAFAALATKNYDDWIPIVRPWAITAVSLVGLGLCMGGFWAYETLGWGGFWMWDPVENVSFVPWCFGVALIHGVIVQATKKKWQISNLLFGGLPFLVFLYGTFLTRSGFLSDASVHSFAEMDRSALRLLIVILGGSCLGFLGLWTVRAFQARRQPIDEVPRQGVRREALYIVGIATLLMMGIATTIGMSVPLIQALRGEKPRIVEEGLYHQVLPWIFVPLMLLMAIAPFASWNGSKLSTLGGKVYTVLCVTVGITGALLFATVTSPFGKRIELAPTVKMLGRFEVPGLAWLMVLVAICVFVLVANAARVLRMAKRSKLGIAPFMAHIGVAVLMAGLIISRGFETKARSIVMENHPGRLLNYEVRYAGMTSVDTDRDNKVRFDVFDPHKPDSRLFTATPGLYKVSMGGEESTMVWPHIERGLLMDTYVTLGQPQTEASEQIRVPLGKSVTFGGLTLTYEKATREGEFGLRGTKFGALVRVNGGAKESRINPRMELADGGATISHAAKLDDGMELAMVGMDAADKSVVLQVRLTSPMYPIEIYHKPMTILVWIGTGLMTMSGFVSAYYRRVRRLAPIGAIEAPRNSPKAKDLVTAYQGDTR